MFVNVAAGHTVTVEKIAIFLCFIAGAGEMALPSKLNA